MGMFDTVIVEEPFVFQGQTFQDFQTKDLDCCLDTIYFGREVPSEQIPISREFVFYGTSIEEEKTNLEIQQELKKKLKMQNEKYEIDLDYYKELQKLTTHTLYDFIGLLDHKNIFYMILSIDKSKVLKKIDNPETKESLYGWDDGKVFFYYEGKEYCINDYPTLHEILKHQCKLLLLNKDKI